MFALIIVANFGLLSGFSKMLTSLSASEFTVEDSVSISNKNFNNYSSGQGYPYTPNNFTFSTTNADAKHGVINVSDTTYKNNYEKYELGKDDNPGRVDESADNYALMINSREESNSYGYTSSNFTMDKNAHFYVSVNVYTDNVDSASTLYLFDGDEIFASIPNINTHKSWQKYFFFVSTSEYESKELSLGLWLGSKETSSKACVFFDQVSCGKISNSTIYSTIDDETVDGKTTNLNAGKNIYYKNLANDNTLEVLAVNSDNFKISDEGNSNVADANYTVSNFTQDNVNGTITSVLRIQNKKANNTRYETKNAFTFESNKVYKVSMKAKASLTSGSAYLKLVEDKVDGTSSDALTISTNSNKFENGYVEYSFIVNSDSRKTRDFKLVFGLGVDESSMAIGEVYFKDFRISSVPYSEYASAGTNSKTLDLSSSYSSSQTIKNFAFDLSKPEEISKENEVKVNAPANWKIVESATSYAQVGGVFNVKDFDKLSKANLTNITNPGFIDRFDSETNNVLMLHNEMSDYVYGESDTFTLSKNSYYALRVWVQTQISGSNQAGASIVLKTENVEIARLDNIKTGGEWLEYSLYVKTGYEDLSASLELSLGNSEQGSNGYAFFDNCIVTNSESLYNSATTNKYDLTNPMNIKGDDDKPKYFEGKSTNNVTTALGKLINLGDDLSFDFASEYIESVKNYTAENKNVLYINSTTEEDYYHFDTKLNYALTSGSFYKITVDVYTGFLASEEGKAGAGFKLSNITESEFTGIVSNKVWTTYTFLISPDADVTTQISLSLGSENNTARGTVVFGNLTFEQISDEATYTNLVENADDNTKVVGEVIKEEEPEEDSAESKNDINWLLLTSTLTAVAVIIAVLGVAFKKLVNPHVKYTKKSKVEYDRNNTVMHQKYRKLAYLKRDKDVRALEKKADALKEDRIDKENKYKELLKKIREVKLANRDGKLNAEITLLNKEVARASKDVAKSGLAINKINNEIAFMKTEGYLQNLEKRLKKQDEMAKQNGTSIEEILKDENIDVDIEKDDNLDKALSKADDIIASKKEEERLKAEEEARKEQERLEQERLEKERLEREKLEQERIEKERLEQEKANEQVQEEQTSSEVQVQPQEEKVEENVEVEESKEVEQVEKIEQTTKTEETEKVAESVVEPEKVEENEVSTEEKVETSEEPIQPTESNEDSTDNQ